MLNKKGKGQLWVTLGCYGGDSNLLSALVCILLLATERVQSNINIMDASCIVLQIAFFSAFHCGCDLHLRLLTDVKSHSQVVTVLML